MTPSTPPVPAPHGRPPVVRAAGALCWDRGPQGLRLLVVHRPRYHDWSWPKGKLEGGEPAPAAAVREVAEETGLEVALGVPLPSARYPLGADTTKHVSYWAAHVPGCPGWSLADLVWHLAEVQHFWAWVVRTRAADTSAYSEPARRPDDELLGFLTAQNAELELMLDGAVVSPDEAERIGLITRAVDADQLLPEALMLLAFKTCTAARLRLPEERMPASPASMVPVGAIDV